MADGEWGERATSRGRIEVGEREWYLLGSGIHPQ